MVRRPTRTSVSAGWYLIPAVAGVPVQSAGPDLSLDPARLRVWLFEQYGRMAGQHSAPPCRHLAVTAAAAILIVGDDPGQLSIPGAVSGSLYRLTQPWVALHYFKMLFPAHRTERR